MFYLSANAPHTRLASYSASVTGKRAMLKITIEVTDSFELSHLLRSLEELQEQQKQHARQAAAPKRPPANVKARRAIDRQVLLALPAPSYDNRGGSDDA